MMLSNDANDALLSGHARTETKRSNLDQQSHGTHEQSTISKNKLKNKTITKKIN